MRKVALVTGAGSGIGRATALAFARADASTVVVDISADAGEETVQLIQRAGGEAMFIRADVSLASDVSSMVTATVEKYKRLDWAFNNAGIATRNYVPIAEFSESEWDRMIAINLKGVWLCMKYQCQQMLKQNAGAIVNTSSIMGLVSRPGHSAYSAAKAGVIGLSRSVALDYAKNGIRVNVVCPGGIHTPMTANPDMVVRLTDQTPMSRLGEPREIADTVVWLCSEQSSFITGQVLAVDGGFTVM